MNQDQESASTELSSTEKAELARLREFMAEFKRLIRQYYSTLPRWRHYRTQWMWLYLRGMVCGETPQSVRQRRLDELEVDRINNEEKDALQREIRSAACRVMRYAKIEMFGGPADGQVCYVALPIAETRTAISSTADGEVVRSLYRRPQGEIGDLVTINVRRVDSVVPDDELERAFRGKRATRFLFSHIPDR
jgi:hypothetical protein